MSSTTNSNVYEMSSTYDFNVLLLKDKFIPLCFKVEDTHFECSLVIGQLHLQTIETSS